MADKTTVHHLLFPRTMWQRAGPSNKLRTSFTIKIPRSKHDKLNEWTEQTIGFIPPIPPQELATVHSRVEGHTGTITDRLAHLIKTIREVANDSLNSTVRQTMTLTWQNLERQGRYLGILPDLPID